MVARRAQLGRLHGLPRRSHGEDVGRREHLLHDRQRVRHDSAKVQSLAGRDARLRGVRDARSSRFCSAALIILEETVPSYSIGMEPHFESPSEAEVHKLSVLCLYEPVSNCSPHRGDEGVELDAHTRERAGVLRVHDPRPLEHVDEDTRCIAGLTPARWQAVLIRACAPIKRHRVRAECQRIRVKRPGLGASWLRRSRSRCNEHEQQSNSRQDLCPRRTGCTGAQRRKCRPA